MGRKGERREKEARAKKLKLGEEEERQGTAHRGDLNCSAGAVPDAGTRGRCNLS